MSLVDPAVVSRERMRSTGVQVRATVSDQGYARFGESPRLLAKVTFAFRDATGAKCRVRRMTAIHATDPIVEGQTTRLWYDPADPADRRRIAIELVDGDGSGR